MANSILPSGEELKVTPEEVLRYLNPDGIRQMLRQERLHWNLKPNRDVTYYDQALLYRYGAELHNAGSYMRMEVRTYPDNGAPSGYAGINIDSGVFGIPHNYDKWDQAMSEESLQQPVNRLMMGAQAVVKGKTGTGLDDSDQMVHDTENRMAAFLMDPYDGRAYLLSNDPLMYQNNDRRPDGTKIPKRAVARICDIPTKITDLGNDMSFVADPDYHHTENNFTHSNRFVLDNLDDRTFVYPEIARDKNGGDFIENYRVGLNGENTYGESDGEQKINTQPDLGQNPELGDYGDRLGEANSSYHAGNGFSGVRHPDGYLPGVFRSLEELKRVDLIDQRQTPREHSITPGAKRTYNYYIMDGNWSPTWFDREVYGDSYLAQSLNPANLELSIENQQPIPYSQMTQALGQKFDMSQLYQWRYNRIDTTYPLNGIRLDLMESGSDYKVGDVLSWVFGELSLQYIVDMVGADGQIIQGHYVPQEGSLESDPSTGEVAVSFLNTTGTGAGAKLRIRATPSISVHATQIKNNLYAYVDVTPSVRSDNGSEWSDTSLPDNQNGYVITRSTAAGPAYSGINSGRGGPAPTENTKQPVFYEHGGNATAGVHVHLFRYVINTQDPQWVIRDGVQVFTGEWVDQGPMGVERPCDIKALLFSNPDTNNFNNYYKFTMDSMGELLACSPDGMVTSNPNAVSIAYIHVDNRDPDPDRRFTTWMVDPTTSRVRELDVTDKVLYINGATGLMFIYNASTKIDPTFGYGYAEPGWRVIAGGVTR